MEMIVNFTPPAVTLGDALHHSAAAAGNISIADQAILQLRDALSGSSDIQTLLLKAAAGAGKSYVLRKMVADAIKHPNCVRVLVVAFTNKQVWALADALGSELGRDKVFLYSSKSKFSDANASVTRATVVDSAKSIPSDVPVVLTTSHLSGSLSVRGIYKNSFSASHHADYPFDVMFIDEAWQLPHHLRCSDLCGSRRRWTATAARNWNKPVARRCGFQSIQSLANQLPRQPQYMVCRTTHSLETL